MVDEVEKSTRNSRSKAPAVYAALGKVAEGLGSIPKNGHMFFPGKNGKPDTDYWYLRADDVQEAINPLLVENGLIVQSEYTVKDITRPGFREGQVIPYVYVELSLTYVAVSDGSSLSVSSVGESQAADDKSINKALTQAIKNAHRATFQFASGEPEPDDLPPAAVKPEPAALRNIGTMSSMKAGVSASEKDKADLVAARNELAARFGGDVRAAQFAGNAWWEENKGLLPTEDAWKRWTSSPAAIRKFLSEYVEVDKDGVVVE